jgi:hypothetical protein
MRGRLMRRANLQVATQHVVTSGVSQRGAGCAHWQQLCSQGTSCCQAWALWFKQQMCARTIGRQQQVLTNTPRL